ALGTAAVTLNQDESSLKWITAASCLIYWVLFHDQDETDDGYKQINADGGYGEGPNYMRYAFTKLIPMFVALDNFNNDWEETFDRSILDPGFYPISIGQIEVRSPLHDTRYTALYEWINNIRLQDGRMPSIEDTPSQVYFPELAIISEKYSFPVRSTDLSISSNKLLSEKLSTLRVDYICAGNYDPDAVVDPDLSLNLPAAGLAVFRSSWEQDGIYFNISADNGLGHLQERGHGHADVSSFMLSYKGVDLIRHPGYGGWDLRYRLNRHKNHNAVLVKDQFSSDYFGAVPPTGPAASFSFQLIIEQKFDASKTQGYLQNFYVDDYISFVQVHTNYGKRYMKETPLVYIPLEGQEIWSVDSDDPTDIDFYRRVAFVDNKYFVIVDDIFNNLEESRSYAWRTHLNTGFDTEGQFFVDENGGIIANEGVYCKLFTTASSGIDSINIGSDYHADNNGEEFFMQHETLTCFSTDDSPVFLSILYPYDDEEPEFTEFQNETTLGIIIPVEGSQNKIDVILSQSGNQYIEFPASTINGYDIPQIATDANVAVLRFDQNTGSQVPLYYFGNQGDYLEINGIEYSIPFLDIMEETIPGHNDPVSRLYPNFPNPFNGDTQIQFKVFRESQITLRIIDLSGRTVAILSQGKFSPGFYETKWDGRDGNGKLVASGMYYYTLRATISGNSSSMSRKLIFIK
ncbi:MAG: FlgD immunoglobulin-like domain containing protein, partial [Candidatus Neomarinimicrobiota bacterium]